MTPFAYHRATSLADAANAVRSVPGAVLLAGGTSLVDLMKLGVERPKALVDITRLDEIKSIELLDDGTVRIGALASNSHAADHPLVRARFPMLTESILAGASTQLRNMASVGGNLLQRTRCVYFRDTRETCCNKREPGSGCSAIGGFDRMHAVLGVSEHCIATYPSDMAVAVAALDASVHLLTPTGETRVVPAADFHRLPGDTPQRDTAIEPGEVITAVEVPPTVIPPASQRYLKVRDRVSYEFALASAAVGLDVEDGTIRAARVALGGVSAKPWRTTEAEATLVGRRTGVTVYREAAEAAFESATPHNHNAFKVELGRRTLVRALELAAGDQP